MESYQQQQDYLGGSFFQPIHSDLSYESYEEEPTFAQECFNKSIFRQPEDAEGVESPPLVSRANPVGMDEDDDDDDDYSCCHDDEMYNVITPYPYSPCQEELEDRDHLVSEIPQLATLSDERIDYSFYFASNIQGGSMWEDGIAHSYSTQTESCAAEQRRTASPAQISDTDSMGEG
eukprot:CAMPEP_0119017118 /NCGR_PEP_ID=MMETSP1176-20130426/15435_1 /TAXON_ID=265551 /ORGANISM="Synedropsis recta cf, Strain CCMP1620" /LENGTH=175 /DNA_ID=CAMNT_0006970731 /DNA_START=34 /DNA_END=558 /DNA_ORIENTATION=-